MTSAADAIYSIIDTNYNANPPTKTLYIYHNSRRTTDWLDEPWTNTTYCATGKIVIIILTAEEIYTRRTSGSKNGKIVGSLVIWGVSEANVDSGLAELKQIADNYTSGILEFSSGSIIDSGDAYFTLSRFELWRVVNDS